MTDTITRNPDESAHDFAKRLRAHAKSLNPGRVRFKHMGVRVTEDEAAEIAAAAESLGLSVSDLLRRAGMHALENRRLRGQAFGKYVTFASADEVATALAEGRISEAAARLLNKALTGDDTRSDHPG